MARCRNPDCETRRHNVELPPFMVTSSGHCWGCAGIERIKRLHGSLGAFEFLEQYQYDPEKGQNNATVHPMIGDPAWDRGCEPLKLMFERAKNRPRR